MLQRTLSVLLVSFIGVFFTACGAETPVASATQWMKVEDFTASLDPAGFLDVPAENLPFRDWILRVNGKSLPADEDRAMKNMAGPFAEALVAYERTLYGDVRRAELFRTEIEIDEDEDGSTSLWYTINVRTTIIGHSGVGDAVTGGGLASRGQHATERPTSEQLRHHRDEVILRMWREATEEILNK